MSRRITFHFAAFSLAAVAVALAVAVIGAKPAQALPSYKSTCSSCHSATPSGTVTATPSKTTVTPGEAYTVNVAVGLTASGTSGYWLTNNDAATPAVSIASGTGASPFTANMTAPNAAGTYTYKVWGAKGTPGNGMALSTTYQITVAAAPVGDAVAPVTSATGAVDNGWYTAGLTLNLSATDNAGGSGVASITYTLDGGAPVTVNGSTAQVPVTGDGTHTVTYRATDSATTANTEALKTITVHIDSVKPVAAVLAKATVKKGAKATIKYQVVDTPATGNAVTTIKIKNKTGKVVKTLKSTKPVGAAQSVKFTCKLAKGVYKVTAQARDTAGNVSVASVAKKLTVK